MALPTSPVIVAPEAHGVQAMFAAAVLYAWDPQGLHPTNVLVASPPYPAAHSQRPVSTFKTALAPQAQESELVALPTSPVIVAPEGHGVQAMLPVVGLKDVEPHGLHPAKELVASPP